MPVMVIVTRSKRYTLDISGWDERTRSAVALSAEADGYEVIIGQGVPAA